MRDNTRRLNPAAYSRPPQRTQPSEQEKNVAIPSFYVDLPSRGVLYPKEHPLHNKQKIEIKEMTAREEEILSSQEHSKAGTTMDKFMDAVIVDLNIDPSSILLADRAAIIYESRKRSYSSMLHLPEYECPKCNTKQKVKTQTNFIVEERNYSDFEDFAFINEDGFLEFTLSTGSRLTFSAVNIKAEDEIVKFISENPDASFINILMKNTINSFDEETNKEKIVDMLLDVPAKEARKIREVYQKMIPIARAEVSIKCKSCDDVNTMEVPLNADWFWLVDGV